MTIATDLWFYHHMQKRAAKASKGQTTSGQTTSIRTTAMDEQAIQKIIAAGWARNRSQAIGYALQVATRSMDSAA